MKKKGPEAVIQDKIVAYLKVRDWYPVVTHGNIYQSGLPDLFICHFRHGHRWVEVKNPENYRFTGAQLEVFPKLCANGSGVWILTAPTEEEYAKLFKPYNWYMYLLGAGY
jgi:hypothetical protein